MHDTLTNLSTYGYLFLFFYSFGGGFVALVAAGVLSYMNEMNIVIVIAIATISNAIGSSVLFYLSRYNKDQIMPYLRRQRRNLALANLLIKKHGNKMIFIQKYIYGIKTLIPMAIGFTKYPFKKFLFLNFIASFIWALLFGLGSFFVGEFFINAYEVFAKKPYLAPLFIVLLIGSIYLYFKINTKKRKKDV